MMDGMEMIGARAIGLPRAAWEQAFDLLAVEPPCYAIGVVADHAMTAGSDEARDAWQSLGDCIAAILHGGGRPN